LIVIAIKHPKFRYLGRNEQILCVLAFLKNFFDFFQFLLRLQFYKFGGQPSVLPKFYLEKTFSFLSKAKNLFCSEGKIIEAGLIKFS